MALKKFATSEMVNLSGDLVKRGSAERAAIEAVEVAAALLPSIEDAHRGLLAAQPPSNSTIEKLTEELARADAQHDDLIRGIDGRLASEIQLALDPVGRDPFIVARAALFPRGLTDVNLGYSQQAGEAKLREARVTGDVERTISKLKTGDGSTLLEQYQRLQKIAARIGAKEKQRAELDAASASGPKAVQARNQWIRAIHALSSVLAVAGIDETPILGRIRAAEAKAERAGTGAVEEPTDPSVPIPGGEVPAPQS